MLIKTTRFGEIEILEDKIILFSSGMIGFENYKKYILFEHISSQNTEVRSQKSEANTTPVIVNEVKQSQSKSQESEVRSQDTENKKQNKVEDNNESSCFVWLQSTELSNLAFLLIDPFSFCPKYDFSLSEKDVKELKIENAGDILVLTTVSLPKDAPQNMTSNLLAPVIINSKKQIGKQVILSENNYGVTENIFERLQKLNPKKEEETTETAVSATS